MNFPSFDDFLLEMGPERVAQWSDTVNDIAPEVTLPLTPFNIQKFYSSFMLASAVMSKAMMRDYHEWLIKELEKHSVRLIPK